MLHCERWASVDFGRGPVEVRCTEVGDHNEHKCVVLMQLDSAVYHKNVFDGKGNVVQQ